MKKQNDDNYDVAGWRELSVYEGLDRHPLDRSILIVSETMVVPREEIARQCSVCQLDCQLTVHPTKNDNKLNAITEYQTRAQ